jgi:hypothetical protein
MSLLKKVNKSKFGFEGQTPISYLTQIFNQKTKNSRFTREVQSSGGSTPPSVDFTLLTTENNEILLTEDSFELILE